MDKVTEVGDIEGCRFLTVNNSGNFWVISRPVCSCITQQESQGRDKLGWRDLSLVVLITLELMVETAEPTNCWLAVTSEEPGEAEDRPCELVIGHLELLVWY